MTAGDAALPLRSPRPLHGPAAAATLLRFVRAPASSMLHLHRRYGGVVPLRALGRDYAFVSAPELLQTVLGDTDRFRAHDAGSLPVQPPPGSALARLYAGLHQMNGATHRQHRRLMAPAFQRQRLDAYAQDVTAETDRELGGWSSGSLLDVRAAMRRLALAVAFRALLGLESSARLCSLLGEWLERVFWPPSFLLPFDLPGLPYRKLLGLSAELEAEIRRLIRERQAGASGADVLSALLVARDEDGTRMTEDELIGQTAALFVAGHALSANALAWTLFLLSQHSAIASELASELAALGEAATPAEIESAPLLDGVVKESMRLLPPVAFWSRRSACAFELGSHALGEGTVLVLAFAATHRIPELYPEPASFRPERWRSIRPGPYEYLPFSAGPRSCIGGSFAMMEMKLILARILRRFRPALEPGSRVDCAGLVLSSPRSLVMRLDDAGSPRPGARARGSASRLVDLPQGG